MGLKRRWSHYLLIEELINQTTILNGIVSCSMFVDRLNQLEKAVACFSTALKLDPFFVDGYIARGNVYMDYGHAAGLLTAR